ncbi:protocadherin Fat 1-like [Dreissena polymorpha]|uniref:protocadherin Fat 1-like n=1 Tax=Dreissena polymorpha TaxID=45954 RepID=UPI0022640433|nr:protocadherin Fat 1-like [Dreissena polymorpha]
MTSMPEVPELFEISPATGEIMTVVNLKYAVHNGYLLTITASDGKDNTTGYLKINLYNVNSVPVIRNLPAEIYVNENTQFDTVLYTVYTDDPRDVVYVYFVVDPVALKNKFYMHFNTTQLRQHHSLLDYEECNYFVVTFYAYDPNLATSAPYNLTINVLDVNEACDFTPDLYYISLDEGNSFTNNVDPNFNVKDVDVGDIVTFEIVKTSTAASTYFAINQSTGVITHALNYNVDTGVHPSSVTLLILGVDLRLRTCTATVSVTVTDVNDNVPSFSAVSYVKTIYEHDGLGTTVMQLKNSVTDRDSGNNAVIVFTYRAVTAGSDAFFHWTPDGVGTLTVSASDVMTPGDIHRFLVTAADMGQPPLAATMTVDIVYLLNGTTLAPEVTTVTETTSGEFWEQTPNIVLVTLVCFLGMLLAGGAAFLAYRKCSGNESKSSPHSSPSSQHRKIKPQPATPPDRPKFDFWHSSPHDIGGVIHQGLVTPSI